MVDQDHVLAREIIEEHMVHKGGASSVVEEFIDDIEVRLDQVKIFYPIFEVLRKRQLGEKNVWVVPELCFLLLTYLIYEGKLKYRGLSYEELAGYFLQGLKEIMPEKVDEGRGLLSDILDGLQNGGRNFVLSTYSFKTKGFKEKYIKFIEIKQSDEGVLLYHITEQGVEFYLKTKEFPEETKITINLLLFQKQMEKGAFGFAYETVRRLNMEVQKKKDRKHSLLENLMYGAGDSEAYIGYHRSINLQFEEEAELFKAAVKNVGDAFGEYVDRINKGEADRKDKRIFQLIKIIEKEISLAQRSHLELLKEAAAFTREYDEVLKVRRKAIFSERFNFIGEFEKVVDKNGNPEVLKYLFEPLLNPAVRKSFNPLQILDQQRISFVKVDDNESVEEDRDVDRLTLDMMARRRVKGNFVFYARELLEAMDEIDNELCLKDYCERMVEIHSEDIVYNGDFLAFILEMNRGKKTGEQIRNIEFAEITHEAAEYESIEEVFSRAQSMVGINKLKGIVVRSFPEDELQILLGLKITNILFTGVMKS